jgi:hypothetical protein
MSNLDTFYNVYGIDLSIIVQPFSLDTSYPTASASTFNFSDLNSMTLYSNVPAFMCSGTAFRGCTSLTSVNIASIVRIGEQAFQNCNSLTSVNIESSDAGGITVNNSTINTSSFENCTSLLSITIPNSIGYMGSNVFKNCTSLISVIINNHADISNVEGNSFTDVFSFTDVSSNINSSIQFYNTGSFDNLSATWKTISYYYYTKLYDNLAIPNIQIMNFYLPHLNVSVNSLSASLFGAESTPFSGDATVAVDIPLENAMNIFQFQTGSNDINNDNADDIKYRVLYTGNSSYNMVFNIDTLSEVITGAIYTYASNKNLTYDYVRYLAEELFNTHLGVDLFSNETELRTTLRDNFSISFDSNMTRLHAVETDDSENSPSKTILNQIIDNVPERLNDIYSLAVGNNWFKSPLVLGDILNFRLTVKAAAGQNTVTTVAAIEDRVYLIKATLTV